MSASTYTIMEVDPQGVDAMALLREAAIEARTLYQVAEGTPWPGNPPTPPGGIYLVAYDGALPVACGALRPLDTETAEVRRMYVLKHLRRAGLARTMLRRWSKQPLPWATAGSGWQPAICSMRRCACMRLTASPTLHRLGSMWVIR
ncbi:MAG: hypothetical protein RL748_3667 [Pseudomonadota bacterium]|jgi:GNAT superfamily N-acetyltransferase